MSTSPHDNRHWQFGRCTVHLPTRELLRDGRLQSLPPKAFDLLVVLLRERDRVVPADELVAAVWPGLVLTKSVLPRTVMILRRALGETASSAALIRNLHGVGYRFVGEVRERPAEPPPAPAPRRPLAGRGRIGLLPCRNDSGDPALDWLRLGLPSLASDALQADTRLQVLPPELLATAPDAHGAAWAGEAGLRRLQAAHGLDHLVQAVLRLADGTPVLDFQVHGRTGAATAGSLRDARPVALGARLAQALQSMLFPGDEALLPAAPRDDFALQALARALDQGSRGDWPAALELLAVVCRLEPGNRCAALWRLRLLAAQGDPQALALAEPLLAQARALDDHRLQARVHAALATPLAAPHAATPSAVATGWQPIARQHRSAALALLDGAAAAHWSLPLRSAQALDAAAHADIDDARRLHREAIADAHALRSAVTEAPLQFSLAMLELAQGDIPRARHGLESAVALQRPLHQPGELAASLAMLAWVHAALGLWGRAATQGAEALALLDGCRQPPPRAVAVLTVLGRVLHEAGTRAQAAQLHDACAAWAAAPGVQACRQALLACQALRDGDTEAARRLLAAACAAAAPHEPLFLRTWLPLRQRLELACGHTAGAEALQPLIDALPGTAGQPDALATRLRLDAARQRARGDTAQALLQLRRAVAAAPTGWAHARACLDAAWLLAEQDQPDEAQALLAAAGAWADEHPDGLTVGARVLLLQGRPADAAMHLRRALVLLADRATPWHQALLTHCERTAAGWALPPPQALPCLLGDAWLTGPVRRTVDPPPNPVGERQIIKSE